MGYFGGVSEDRPDAPPRRRGLSDGLRPSGPRSEWEDPPFAIRRPIAPGYSNRLRAWRSGLTGSGGWTARSPPGLRADGGLDASQVLVDVPARAALALAGPCAMPPPGVGPYRRRRA